MIYYHLPTQWHKTHCENTFQYFRDVYSSKIPLLSNQVFTETHYQEECETNNPAQQGVLLEPTMAHWLRMYLPGQTTGIHQLLPDDKHATLIVSWLSLFNLNFDDYNALFGSYAGQIIIDDTFEVHTTRIHVFREMLIELGYNIDNVSFFTNGPTPDNYLDYDKKIFRHNWLHLSEYARSLDSTRRNRITDIQDQHALTEYSNKKYTALYLNGHSTAQREYVLGCFADSGSLENLLYSFRDPVDMYKKFFCSATDLPRENFIPRVLPDDIDDSMRTMRDRYKQDWWWQQSFYNINVETNINWRNHDVRLLTEKWLKGVMYLTPSYNIGDYYGLEEYQSSLGFNNYTEVLDKSYDSETDWHERSKKFVDCVNNNGTPSKQQWEHMMNIAHNNKQHLVHEYIPGLVSTFKKILKNIT